MKLLPILVGVAVLAAPPPAQAEPERGDSTQASFAALLEQRVEAAAKYDQSVHDAAASVTVVTAEEIERYGYRNLDDVLRAVRSFYVSNDRNYAYAGMRGFGRPGDYNNRILLLVDGHAVNDNVFGSAPVGTELGSLDPRIVERIEIVRGPGSALYGANAMLAVINLVTREPKTMSPVRLGLESGSAGYRKGAASLAKVLENGWQMSLSGQASNFDGEDLYYAEYDDPSTNNGIADDLDWDKYYDVQASLATRTLRLEAMWASREKAIPTGAWGVDFNDARSRTRDVHALVDAEYEHAFGASRSVLTRAYANRYEYEGAWPTGGIDVRDASTGQWYGAEVRHLWDMRPNNRLAVGVQAERHARADYQVWNDGVLLYWHDVTFSMLSAYAQEEVQPKSWLSLMLGARLDDYSNYDAAVSPRAAIIVNPRPSSALKLLYGDAFRVPTTWERFYDDPTTGYKANAGLEPETIRTYEVVWEQDLSDGLGGVVSLFRNEFDGLIDLVIDPSDSLYVNRNLVNAHAQGVEFELRGVLGAYAGYASYSYQAAKTDDDWLTNSPHHLAKAGVVVPVASFLRCGIESQYETERLTVYGTETDPFFLMNLNLTTVFHPFATRTTASLLVKNVFDEAYETPGGFEHAQPAIAQDGRTIIVGLETRF
jgi:iron complex outermembrane receptor protein